MSMRQKHGAVHRPAFQTGRGGIRWWVALGGLIASGCGWVASGPARQVQLPASSASGASVDQSDSTPPIGHARDGVQRASFEQPTLLGTASSARPLRPFPEWTEQEAAAEALGRIGAAAVPQLVEALRSPDADVRLKAVEVLGRMGPEAADAVGTLVPLLNDPDERVRKATIRTLGQIGPAAKEAVPALVERLLTPAATP